MTEAGVEATVGLTSRNALYAGTTAESSRTGASGITNRSFRNPRAGSCKEATMTKYWKLQRP